MIYKRPFRLTTLHFEQRGLIDDDTFIVTFLTSFPLAHSAQQSLDYTCPSLSRPVFYGTVKIKGSPSVITTECSKCAVNEPSAEATVH
jgi:hypothetical protein